MKYLLKFNESKINGEITDRDFELIENCFLDYIDQDKCTTRRSDDSVFFYFKMPNLKRKNTWPPHSPRMLWEWTYEFITQITGYIKRCESYGFVCYFHFFGQFPCIYYPAQQNPGDITMSVHRKGSEIDEYLTMDSHVVEDALIHIQNKLVGLKESFSFGRPKLNESNEPHEDENKGGESSKNFMITDRDFEIIENCFLDYIDRKELIGAFRDVNSAIETQSVNISPRHVPLEQRAEYFLDLLTRMAGDIKRCESYGYEFKFHLLEDSPRINRRTGETIAAKGRKVLSLSIWVAHKGYWETREIIKSPRVLNYNTLLHHLTEIVNYSRKT